MKIISSEELIKCVRNYPILYSNTTNTEKSYVLKQKAWEEISELLGVKVVYCKKRWKNLRDAYIKYIKAQRAKDELERNTPTSKKLVVVKRTAWAKEMAFLEPYITNTPHKVATSMPRKVKHQATTSTASFVNKTASVDVKQSTLLSNKKSSSIDGDEVDLIFLAYAKTVKKFSARRQTLVKFKISEILMKAELDQQEENELGSSTHSIQPVECVSLDYDDCKSEVMSGDEDEHIANKAGFHFPAHSPETMLTE